MAVVSTSALAAILSCTFEKPQKAQTAGQSLFVRPMQRSDCGRSVEIVREGLEEGSIGRRIRNWLGEPVPALQGLQAFL